MTSAPETEGDVPSPAPEFAAEPRLAPREASLERYAPALVEEIDRDLAKWLKSRIKADPPARIEKLLGSHDLIRKALERAPDSLRRALTAFARLPGVELRHDHALALLEAVGAGSGRHALREALQYGLVWSSPFGSREQVTHFDVPDPLPPAALPRFRLAPGLIGFHPETPVTEPVAAAAESESSEDGGEEADGHGVQRPDDWFRLNPVEAPNSGWREVDGWEIPIRLAQVWQLARRVPIKRTQQQTLFKRDHERLTRDPILAGSMLDGPVPVADAGLLAWQLAQAEGWLDPSQEEQRPELGLADHWPESRNELLLRLARHWLQLTRWCELPDMLDQGAFATWMVSGRMLLLVALAELATDRAVRISDLTRLIETRCRPWTDPAERVGKLRDEAARGEIARQWTRSAVCGVMFQLGLVRLAPDADGELVMLTERGRKLAGLTPEATEPTVFDQTLLVQPNHAMIVYRQGLTPALLGRLFMFAEPKSIGAALTFELTADSVYLGLEAGLEPEMLLALLARHQGREVPPGVVSSIRTWVGKRDRLAVHSAATLIEFASPDDLRSAIARGLVGDQLSDRILLVGGERELDLSMLRITASRDYRLDPETCVGVSDDGVVLTVDMEKSDLLLDAELRRFAEPMSLSPSGAPRFRIDRAALARGFALGVDESALSDWFRQRAGREPPASVIMLARGLKPSRQTSRTLRVVTVDDPLLAEGLAQHPTTAEFILERLGPRHLAIHADRFETFVRLAADLGHGITEAV
jgi:hypothetical protein